MQNLKVQITYRNKDLYPIAQNTYTLQEYCEYLMSNIMRVMSDVQDVYYDKQEWKRKQAWSEQDIVSYRKIRHKLLDIANDIKRLPENIVEE